MMIRKSHSLFLFATILWSSVSISGELRELMQNAVQNAYRIRTNMARKLQSSKDLESAKSQYRPSINLSLEAAYENDRVVGNREYYGPGATLDYDLLSYDRSSQVGLRAQRFRNATKEIEFSQVDVLFQLLSLVYDYHLANELLKISEANRDSLALNMKMVKRKVRAGDLSNVNYQRSQARHLAAKAQYTRTQQLVRNIKFRFEGLTELSFPEVVEVPNIKTHAEYKNNQIEKSVAFLRFNQQLKLAQKQIDVARAKEYPKVSFRVTHNEEMGLSSTADDYDTRAFVAVEWPLYTGGRISADIHSAHLNKVVQEKERENLKANLSAEFKTLTTTIENEQKAYEEFKQAAEVALGVLKGRRFEFNQGGGRNDLVLDAEREYLDFKRNEANSFYTIKKSQLRLLWRTGMLSLDSILEPIVEAQKEKVEEVEKK
jgi:outer membrane protein